MPKKKTKPSLDTVIFTEPMTDEEKTILLRQVLNCPAVFQAAVEHLDIQANSDSLDDDHRLLLAACKEVASKYKLKPGDSGFRTRFRIELERLVVDPLVQDEAPEADPIPLMEAAFKVKPSELDATSGIDLLKRLLIDQQVVQPLKDLAGKCQLKQPDSLDAVLTSLLGRVEGINSLGEIEVPSFGDEWSRHQARLKDLRTRKFLGLKTGMKELDLRTQGLRGLILVGAKPNVGKTTLTCCQLPVDICLNHEVNDAVAVIISLDMSRHDLYTRVLSNLSGLDWNVLTRGSPAENREPGLDFSMHDQQRLDTAEKRAKDEEILKRLFILDRSQLGEHITASRLRAIVENCKKKAHASRAFLVVDYLQLLPVPDDVADRGDLNADRYRIGILQEVLNASRTETNPEGDAIVAISEVRKPSKAKDGWGETLSELIGSSRLPYAADAVLLYRSMDLSEVKKFYGMPDDEVVQYRASLEKGGIAPVMLILAKARDGMLRGEWPVEFHFKKSQFEEKKTHSCWEAPSPPKEKLAPPGCLGSTAEDEFGVPLPPPDFGDQPKAKKKAMPTKGTKPAGSGNGKATPA